MERSKQNEVQRDWDIVSRWMLPGIVVLVLLTGVDTLVYHMNERARQATALQGTLPRDYEQTVRALVASSGHSCAQLCSLTPLGALSDRMTLVVTCGTKGADGTCERKASFALTITPSAVPSR